VHVYDGHLPFILLDGCSIVIHMWKHFITFNNMGRFKNYIIKSISRAVVAFQWTIEVEKPTMLPTTLALVKT